MKRSTHPILLLALLALLGFGWGLWQLFSIRFEAGDVYPPYSSLRADPLGTKALHDSFAALGTLRVGRNYLPLEKLGEPGDATVFWLGGDYNSTPEEDWRHFIRSGGRLVVAWSPAQFVERSGTNASGRLPWQQARYRRGPLLPTPPLSRKPEDVAFRENWDLNLSFVPLPGMGSEFKSDRATLKADLPLPAEIAWHSTVCFTNLHSDWKVIYERRGQPVVVERALGAGTVVVSTDAWPVSNEALRRERTPAFLTWLAGSKRRLLFDEHHLGVEESPGLAAMMRRYRMHGIVGAFLILALLFFWRSAASFLPRASAGEATSVDIEGRDAAAGFANLLRRGIRPPELLKTCFAEWKHSLTAGDGCSRGRLDRMEQLLMSWEDTPPRERNPVATYRELHRAWKEKQ
jgi:hypothetical protein